MVEKTKSFFSKIDSLTKVLVFMTLVLGIDQYMSYYINNNNKVDYEKEKKMLLEERKADMVFYTEALKDANKEVLIEQKTIRQALANQYFANKEIESYFDSANEHQEKSAINQFKVHNKNIGNGIFKDLLSLRGKQNN